MCSRRYGQKAGSGRSPSGAGQTARRLLNDHCWRDHRSLLPPFEFLLALLVGCPLACRDFVRGAPFRFHPHVGVARERVEARCVRSVLLLQPAVPAVGASTENWAEEFLPGLPGAWGAYPPGATIAAGTIARAHLRQGSGLARL